MALLNQLNRVVCGAAGFIGSGTKGCKLDPSNIAAFILLPIATSISEELTRELVLEMQKKGSLIVLPNAYNVEWNSEENITSESPTQGIQSLVREGKYSFTAEFDNGVQFQKVLSSLAGQGRWDVLLVDDADNIWGTEGRDGSLRGFRTSMVAHNPYTFLAGTEGAKTSLTVQLARPREFNQSVAVITAESLDFYPSDLDGANEVVLTIVNSSVGALEVRTVLMDNDTFVEGLTADDFLVKANGATVDATNVAAKPETKSYTVTAVGISADDIVEIKLYDSASNSPVIAVGASPDEVLYQSREVTGVITA